MRIGPRPGRHHADDEGKPYGLRSSRSPRASVTFTGNRWRWVAATIDLSAGDVVGSPTLDDGRRLAERHADHGDAIGAAHHDPLLPVAWEADRAVLVVGDGRVRGCLRCRRDPQLRAAEQRVELTGDPRAHSVLPIVAEGGRPPGMRAAQRSACLATVLARELPPPRGGDAERVRFGCENKRHGFPSGGRWDAAGLARAAIGGLGDGAVMPQ